MTRPSISTPKTATNISTSSATANQRSAELHFFQSEIRSRIRRCPRRLLFPDTMISEQRVKSSTELCLYSDKRA